MPLTPPIDARTRPSSRAMPRATPRAALAAMAVGLDAMRAHPLRSALATLGVIIGVAALVAVLALADGIERSRSWSAGSES